MRRLTDRHLQIEIQRTFDGYPDDSLDGWGDIEDAKSHTFDEGDLVAIDTAHGPRRALVVFVSRKYSEWSGDWIQCYKVRLAKADGTLGKAWRWAYPGDLERGFAALKATAEVAQ
ncbi:hypothetical protein [Roseobacter weihaiensis]|uniref:hypothetical protein n=1 Tax=Roseobacter weihaiensis TaxID=2763262 RepID=UPI001D0B94E4|nr:hypothetical protein [Roseobacter sp. H9]